MSFPAVRFSADTGDPYLATAPSFLVCGPLLSWHWRSVSCDGTILSGVRDPLSAGTGSPCHATGRLVVLSLPVARIFQRSRLAMAPSTICRCLSRGGGGLVGYLSFACHRCPRGYRLYLSMAVVASHLVASCCRACCIASSRSLSSRTLHRSSVTSLNG